MWSKDCIQVRLQIWSFVSKSKVLINESQNHCYIETKSWGLFGSHTLCFLGIPSCVTTFTRCEKFVHEYAFSDLWTGIVFPTNKTDWCNAKVVFILSRLNFSIMLFAIERMKHCVGYHWKVNWFKRKLLQI